tara:strand:+ start:64 stop:369 length:306 start_codon:yes stop_codon:yes gene_type:complete
MVVLVVLDIMVVAPTGEILAVAVVLVKMVVVNLMEALALVMVVTENKFLSVILTITGVQVVAAAAGTVVAMNQGVMVDKVVVVQVVRIQEEQVKTQMVVLG